MITIQLHIDGNFLRLGNLPVFLVLVTQRLRLEDLVSQICQTVRPPRLVVLLQSLPLHHALPLPVGAEELDFLLEVHVFQIGDGQPSIPRGVLPADAQPLAALLHLVVLPAPPPERIRIPVDPLHVRQGEGNDPPEVLWVVAVAIPHPSNVDGRLGELGIPRPEPVVGEKVDVVKDEHVRSRRLVLPGQVESDVEQLPAVELAPVIGLLDYVDPVVRHGTHVDLPLEELLHVRNELGEVLGAVLGRVEVAVRDDDGDGGGVG